MKKRYISLPPLVFYPGLRPSEYHPFSLCMRTLTPGNAALLLNFSSASGMGLNNLQLCSEREIAHAKMKNGHTMPRTIDLWCFRVKSANQLTSRLT